MLSLIISAIIGIAVGVLSKGMDSMVWPTVFAVTAFFVSFAGLNFWFGRKLKAITMQLQAKIEAARDEAMRMANRFQTKPIGSPKLMQDKIEKVMADGIREALPILDQAQPLYRWTPLAEKQVKTIKFQMFYQLKEFTKAGEMMDGIMALDPMTVSMKLSIMHKQEAPLEDLEKFYTKGVKRFKYDKALLVYATYAHILARRKEADRLVEVLDEAKDKTENEVMARNWQLAANGKIHNISFTGLGEEWYSLHLEKPPKQKPTKGQMKNNPLMPKGGKRRFR